MRRHLLNLIWVIVFWNAVPSRTAADSADFEIRPVSKDVYAVIAKPGVVANGAFIVNQDDVVVVDTQLRPSWALEVIGEIRKITNKPVRYVINTHWHRDHVQGNQAYVDAFGTGVTIIQQELSREDQVKNQPSEIQKRGPAEVARLEKLLADGKDEAGVPLTGVTRASLQRSLDAQRDYVTEGHRIRLTPGTVTFDRCLLLHEPNREIDLYYFGYAHSRGDLFVYLPSEKIILTGDVLEDGIPIMRSAYPVEWLKALESIRKLVWDINIPGHGDVQRGRDTLDQFASYLNDLVSGVKRSVENGMTEEQTVKSLDLKKYSGMPDYENRNALAIQRTYQEVTGNIPKE